MGKKEIIEALVEGGNAKPTPPLGPQLSQLKLPVGKVVQDINKATQEFKGMQVPVKIIVDVDTKEYEIEVGVPPASALIKKEAGIKKGAHEPGKETVGNITIEQLIKIAKMKLNQMNTNSLKAAAKTIAGVCLSMGVTIEGKDPREIQKEISEGKYDDLFKKEEAN